MEFEFYRNFIVVAETGNLTMAAKKLAIAQPALSAQLRTLEKTYGSKLVQTSRGKRQIVLTDAGEAFLNKARLICETEESITLDMQRFNKIADGTLRISVAPARSHDFIRNYLLPFAADYPDISYQLREEVVSAQLQHIKEHVSDLAFANAPLPPARGLKVENMGKEYYYAYFTPDNALGFHPSGPIDPSDLKGVVLSCNFGCYSLLRKICRRTGFNPKVRFIASSNSAALLFAHTGSSVAIVAANRTDTVPEGLQRQRIADDSLFFEETVFWSDEEKLPLSAQTFLDYYLKKIKNNV